MTMKEQIKILDNRIRQNKVDYDLNRKNAEITALTFNSSKTALIFNRLRPRI